MELIAAIRKPKLSLSTAFAFSSLNIALLANLTALTIYLPRHYARHVGLDLAAVGSAFFLVRLIDVPAEGLIGWAMDRTRTSLGRYRLWTLIGVPFFMLGVFFVFEPPVAATEGYLILWLLVMYLGSSILNLSHLAWASSLAPRYEERSRLFGILTAVGVAGSACTIAVTIVSSSRGLPDARNVPIIGAFTLVVAPLMLMLMLWRTPDRKVIEQRRASLTVGDYLSIIRHPSLARVLLSNIFTSLGPLWMSAMSLFFLTDSRGFTTVKASILLLIYMLSGIPGAPILSWAAARWTNHRLLIVSVFGYLFGLIGTMLVPIGNLPSFAVLIFISGFFSTGFITLTRAMTGDNADELRLKYGREVTGVLFGFLTMSNKICSSLSIGLTFFVLSRVGYVAKEGVKNTPEAIQHLNIVYLSGPIFFVTLGALCMVGYKLGPERHAAIRRQLDERDMEAAISA